MAFKNIVGKKNAGNQHFLLVQQCLCPTIFSSLSKTKIFKLATFASASAWNLVQSNKKLLGKELKQMKY